MKLSTENHMKIFFVLFDNVFTKRKPIRSLMLTAFEQTSLNNGCSLLDNSLRNP
jgi:hypothetical protein